MPFPTLNRRPAAAKEPFFRAGVGPASDHRPRRRITMHQLFYLIGLIVVILAVLSLLA
jgi:hypothetical protein